MNAHTYTQDTQLSCTFARRDQNFTNMARIVLFLLFAIAVNTYSFSQEITLFPKECLYLKIDIDKPNAYPTVFDAIMDVKDTISINLASKDTFISSILDESTNYVPTSWSAFGSHLFDVYGVKKETEECARAFSEDFDKEWTGLKSEKSFQLSSGEKVTISYFLIRGVFLKTPKATDSLGLSAKDYPQIENSCMPVAVTQYCKPPLVYPKIRR